MKLAKGPQIAGSLVKLADFTKAVRAFRKKELDILELRLDTFSESDLLKLRGKLGTLKKRPLILATVRSRKEGGLRALSDGERRRRFELFRGAADLFDLEASSVKLLPGLRKIAAGKLILSYHDFKKTPALPVMEKIFKRIYRLRPLLVKMAFMVKTPTDLFTLLCFLKKHRSQNIILIGMGKMGRASRVLFPLLGSRMTYGAFGNRASAPGQFPVSVLAKKIRSM